MGTVKDYHRYAARCLGRPIKDLRPRPNTSYSDRMAEARKIAKYTLDVLLILVPLVVVIYFLAYPDKFNAFLNWMVGHR